MPILTIDIELPDAEYVYAETLSLSERRRVLSIAATVAFATARSVPSDRKNAEEDNDSWQTVASTPEQVEALATALSQLEAGEGEDGDVLFEKLYQQKGWTMKP